MDGLQVHNHATTWPTLQDGTCKNSIKIELQVGPECGKTCYSDILMSIKPHDYGLCQRSLLLTALAISHCNKFPLMRDNLLLCRISPQLWLPNMYSCTSIILEKKSEWLQSVSGPDFDIRDQD